MGYLCGPGGLCPIFPSGDARKCRYFPIDTIDNQPCQRLVALTGLFDIQHTRSHSLHTCSTGLQAFVGRSNRIAECLLARCSLTEGPHLTSNSQNLLEVSVWLRNLPALAQSGLWIFVFLPCHRIHGIARLAGCHNNTKLVARRREVVVCLITKGNLLMRNWSAACYRSRNGTRKRRKTYHTCAHNISRPEALINLDPILLRGPHVLHPDHTLPFCLQHSLAAHQNRNHGLAWRDARHPAQNDVAHFRKHFALL